MTEHKKALEMFPFGFLTVHYFSTVNCMVDLVLCGIRGQSPVLGNERLFFSVTQTSQNIKYDLHELLFQNLNLPYNSTRSQQKARLRTFQIRQQ